MSRNLSSGDITADRRAEYAKMLSDNGDHAAGVDLMAQALELVPEWPAGWFQLGDLAEKAGEKDRALDAWRRTVAIDRHDVFGATLKMARLENTLPALPPSAYVAGLFNEYAPRFEDSLVVKLKYTLPADMSAMIARHVGAAHQFANAVDLGCGTGLFGAQIANNCFRLEGFDIADSMLAKAASKNIYSHLARADISLPPERSGLFGSQRRADLVSAADVMIYLGDLRAAFTNVAALMRADGVFAFSVEKSLAEEGFELRRSLRFAHSQRHVVSELQAQGLEAFCIEETTIRTDSGAPVDGLMFLARRA
jgi:predicted TPR repeat methyltransferase